MMQFIPIVVIPQIFFARIIPVENMAPWLQNIAKVMPMYYVGSALEGIMYKGYGLIDITNNLLALLFFAVIFILLNIQALKKYRKL
ncbi:P-loop NTPase family protein [Clostridium culturomicium]|uniref:ABC transporter permease n=1 Tax=Clostridium culturomicium TaxID=1499683 RepID=UPI0006944371|nr:ABC transporter permease [Clostridium culturomicium]